MQPHIVDFNAATDKLKAIEASAEAQLGHVVDAARSKTVKERGRQLDRVLSNLGSEACGLLIIFLALVILCAPIGFGLVGTWLAWIGVFATTGSKALAWIAAAAAVILYFRYVWGSRLQSAARHAAAALVAGRPSS